MAGLAAYVGLLKIGEIKDTFLDIQIIRSFTIMLKLH
jgi:hypothetical protein